MHQSSHTSPHPFEEHFDFKVECFASAAEDATTKSLAFDIIKGPYFHRGGRNAEKEKYFASPMEKHFHFTGEFFASTTEDFKTKSVEPFSDLLVTINNIIAQSRPAILLSI